MLTKKNCSIPLHDPKSCYVVGFSCDVTLFFFVLKVHSERKPFKRTPVKYNDDDDDDDIN
jgi:hypothetical protein